MAFSVDDVLAAYTFLKDYRGDIHGLFSPIDSLPASDWRIHGRCTAHGPIWNVVRTQLDLPPAAPVYMRCPSCLLLGLDRRIAPTSVMRLSPA